MPSPSEMTSSSDAPQPPRIDFQGKPIGKDVDFFYLPRHIGQLLSGYSSLKIASTKDEGIVGNLVNRVRSSSILPMVGRNMYVGTEGFAQYVCTERRDHITEKEELLFDAVTDLLVERKGNDQGPLSNNVDYHYKWFNRHTGEIVLQQKGKFNNKFEALDNLRHRYAMQAEIEWSKYLRRKEAEALKTNGYLAFWLFDRDTFSLREYLHLEPQRLIAYRADKKRVVYDYAAIAHVRVKEGWIDLTHQNFEKRWLFGSKGDQERFLVNDLSNSVYFLEALQRLSGRKFIS